MNNLTNKSRRNFLRNLQYVLAGGAATAMLPQLELVGRAMALSPSALSGYRATVCIFLLGGSDSFNMLIPHVKEEHDQYLAARGGVHGSNNGNGLGIARDALLPITDTAGKTWGLNPACTEMKSLFDSGELAFLANVGTLVQPITKTEFQARSKAYPQSLYSHNDQQRMWMMGHSTNLNGSRGWAGQCADRLKAANNNGLRELPPSISLAGNNLYQNGSVTTPYALGLGGVSDFRRTTSVDRSADFIRREALEALLAHSSYTPIMQDQYAVLGEGAMTLSSILSNALDAKQGGDIATQFPGDHLARQLRMVARAIKISRTSAINHSRQIYYVTMGGYDTHDNQMNTHGRLLDQLSGALGAFRTALQEIGALNDVLTFTMSDFGRTLNSNGNGTDHAWGGVQLMMGGTGVLKGKRVYGTYPVLELDGDQSLGRGRMIPTTSTDQYGATIARWLGVDNADLGTIFQGLKNFSSTDLGFLK